MSAEISNNYTMDAQENMMFDDPIDSTMGNLLIILQTEEADIMDKVLLEMLIEDITDFLEGGETSRQFEDTWAALEEWTLPAFITASLRPLPKLVTSPDMSPPSHHKFALNLLAVMVSHENIFTHLETEHKESLTAVVHACEGLDVNAVLCLPLAAVISASLQHPAGRRWAEHTGVWSQLVSAVAASGGGRFRPALSRLLIGRLARLWAGPAAALSGPLQAVSRFLVVPTRRLLQPIEPGTPAAWLYCCDLLLRLVRQLLREPPDEDPSQSPQTEQHRRLMTTLAEQVAVPMEMAPAPYVPAQLFVGLHLLDQSASEAAVTSAVQRACRALSRQDDKGALRNVTVLLLDVCLLGRVRSCHLAAVAAAPVWSSLQRWRASELTPEETAIADKQRKLVEEFVDGDCHLAAVLGSLQDSQSPAEGRDLDLVRTVFLSRADRPCQALLDPVTLCRLVQPWLLLLKHRLVQQPRVQADILSLTANLCGPTDVTLRSDGVTSLLGLEHVIVDLLQGEHTERVAVCALQCLGRCAPLLPPPRGPVWCRLAELLTARLTQPTGEDSLDAAGEAVLALVRTANQRAALARSTNENAALTHLTNGSTAPAQSSNGCAAPAQPANESVECPLSDWLATNRLASSALTSLLRAGPGGRRVADWLLEAAAGPVWSDLEQNTDLTQLLDSGVDGDVVLDTTALLYLRRRLSQPAHSRLSAADWAASLPLLQTALCSGDAAVRRAAQLVYLTAVQNDLSANTPILAQTAVSWLQDGAARALLSLAFDTPASGGGQQPSDSGQQPSGGGRQPSEADTAARRTARSLLRRLVRLLSDQTRTAATGTARGAASASGDVSKNSCDVKQASSDVIQAAGDSKQASGDVKQASDGVTQASGDVTQASGDVTLPTAGDRLEPGGLDTVSRLCGESRDNSAETDSVSRDGQAAVEVVSRDSGAGLDGMSRDAVISSILAESTEEFFGGRVGGCRPGGAARLRRRPEVRLWLAEFLTAAAAEVAAEKEGEVAPPVMEAERTEALVRRVSARVEELFRCATMDRKTEIPTDCY